MTPEQHQELIEIHSALTGLTIMVGEVDLTEIDQDSLYYLYMDFIDRIGALLTREGAVTLKSRNCL